MKNYFTKLLYTLRNPVPGSSVYFVARAHLLFVVNGVIVVLLTGLYPIVEHYYPADGSTFCNVCTLILLINIFTGIYLVMSLVFPITRLYYSLWRGRMREVLLLQPMIALILFIAFMEMFILPGRFIPASSEMLKMTKNLIAMPGFLFAGLITFKLMAIVNANLEMMKK